MQNKRHCGKILVQKALQNFELRPPSIDIISKFDKRPTHFLLSMTGGFSSSSIKKSVEHFSNNELTVSDPLNWESFEEGVQALRNSLSESRVQALCTRNKIGKSIPHWILALGWNKDQFKLYDPAFDDDVIWSIGELRARWEIPQLFHRLCRVFFKRDFPGPRISLEIRQHRPGM